MDWPPWRAAQSHRVCDRISASVTSGNTGDCESGVSLTCSRDACSLPMYGSAVVGCVQAWGCSTWSRIEEVLSLGRFVPDDQHNPPPICLSADFLRDRSMGRHHPSKITCSLVAVVKELNFSPHSLCCFALALNCSKEGNGVSRKPLILLTKILKLCLKDLNKCNLTWLHSEWIVMWLELIYAHCW